MKTADDYRATGAAKLRRYREQKRARGLCLWCSQPRYPKSRAYCLVCLVKIRETNRRRAGCQPWKPGSKGPPGLELRREKQA